LAPAAEFDLSSCAKTLPIAKVPINYGGMLDEDKEVDEIKG
jgi:hypothetical protein